MSTNAPRRRRTHSHWEPFFSPGLVKEFVEGDWKNLSAGSLTFKTFTADNLKVAVETSVSPHFTERHFADCDFTGYFDQVGSPISFTKCTFSRCDFGTSTWSRAKFSKCIFQDTSFTQCEFKSSDFIKCSWSRMGFSGTETNFTETFINNPSEFINSRWVNLSPEFVEKHRNIKPEFFEKHKDAVLYDAAMHETSKEVISRMLLYAYKSVGDETTFYEAGQLTSGQYFAARKAWKKERIANTDGFRRYCLHGSLLATGLESNLMRLVGFTNAWGASVFRPLAMLLVTILLFTIIHRILGSQDIEAAFIKSFEISSIAGYTRAVASDECFTGRIGEWGNLSAAILLYTVFFATIVARICRVR
jgi:hypothetical protein